jgi:hypothetical protein
MPEITVNRFNGAIIPVIEDANPNRNRLFINGQAFDETTLAPYWMQNWHFNSSDTFTVGTTHQDWGMMVLSKHNIQCHATGDTTYYANFIMDTFHCSLDNTNYPAKKLWRTATGKHLYSVPYGDGSYNTADSALYNYYSIWGDDVLTQSQYNSGWSGYAGCFLHEDPSNNRMWGLMNNQSDSHRLVTWTAYDSGLTGFTRAFTVAGYDAFFMGVDNAGWPYICTVGTAGSNLFNYYQVYKYHPSTYAQTQVITNSYRGLNTNFQRAFPSNIRRATADRRVFYSSHFDASSVFAPIRYVFDAATGNVAATNCTMVYGGSDTYATHAERYTLEGASVSNLNTYFMKGYQFTVSGINYITFWICDMASTLGSSGSRWSTDKKRTMLTFTIGSGTGDDVLTYHSKVTFPGVSAMPRNFMPINAEGTHMVVPIAGATRFYSFNPSTGWEQTGSYAVEFRQLGLDSSNRLWGTSREKGFHTVHAITPSTPITITVAMANTSYTYTGNNIATTANINAYDSTGVRVVASVNLTIDGSSMLFTPSNTKNLTITTSASANTTANLVISGGGVNSIVASVNF